MCEYEKIALRIFSSISLLSFVFGLRTLVYFWMILTFCIIFSNGYSSLARNLIIHRRSYRRRTKTHRCESETYRNIMKRRNRRRWMRCWDGRIFQKVGKIPNYVYSRYEERNTRTPTAFFLTILAFFISYFSHSA